jgi:hypothetical protein
MEDMLAIAIEFSNLFPIIFLESFKTNGAVLSSIILLFEIFGLIFDKQLDSWHPLEMLNVLLTGLLSSSVENAG